MADGPDLALQVALVAALRADAGLAALVGPRIYDEPPQKTRFPYVRIGTVNARPLRLSCRTDDDLTFSIEAHSRPVSGRVEAGRIAFAVRKALDGAQLTAPGYTVAWCQYTTQAVSRASDGRSYVATIAFEASLEAQ